MNLDNANSIFHVFELSLWAIAWCYFLPRPVAKWLFLGAWGLCLVSLLVTLVGRATSIGLPSQAEKYIFCLALSAALGATMGFSSRKKTRHGRGHSQNDEGKGRTCSPRPSLNWRRAHS